MRGWLDTWLKYRGNVPAECPPAAEWAAIGWAAGWQVWGERIDERLARERKQREAEVRAKSSRTHPWEFQLRDDRGRFGEVAWWRL